jgi:hypothetical protein
MRLMSGARELKTIGTFLGYPRRKPRLHGLEMSLKYEENVAKCEPIDPKVFSYNIDDVKVLSFIKNWAVKVQDSTQTQNL